MNDRLNAMIGFAVAGAVVVFIAQWQPDVAIGVTGLIALGVALTHTDEITQLVGAFQSAAHPF